MADDVHPLVSHGLQERGCGDRIVHRLVVDVQGASEGQGCPGLGVGPVVVPQHIHALLGESPCQLLEDPAVPGPAVHSVGSRAGDEHHHDGVIGVLGGCDETVELAHPIGTDLHRLLHDAVWQGLVGGEVAGRDVEPHHTLIGLDRPQQGPGIGVLHVRARDAVGIRAVGVSDRYERPVVRLLGGVQVQDVLLEVLQTAEGVELCPQLRSQGVVCCAAVPSGEGVGEVRRRTVVLGRSVLPGEQQDDDYDHRGDGGQFHVSFLHGGCNEKMG